MMIIKGSERCLQIAGTIDGAISVFVINYTLDGFVFIAHSSWAARPEEESASAVCSI